VPPPLRRPLGITLAQTAKDISRAFDDALAAAGGSRPVWLVLLSLKARPTSNQRELAEALGIQGATLTHHLNAMETDGLLRRHRDPSNRRVHIVELTEDGETLFHRLRKAATAFDQQLRGDLTEDDVTGFERILAQLRDNVANDHDTPS
jgi:MarR family transcriptional regulator, transcriptional regulator for hemolysin